MNVIVDTDGLIGSLNSKDQHFLNSQQIIHKLVEMKAKLIYPATVLVETVTLFQGRLNMSYLAEQIVKLLNGNQLIIESVNSKILQEATNFMDFKKSKHNTLFDAIVAVIAVRYKADAIFSFDKFYQKKGFKLAFELTK